MPWPTGLAPKTGPKPSGTGAGPLPRADVLVVTWTVDEGHALSRVLTPGKDSHDDYLPYTHNYATISAKMRKGCPATEAKRLGAYWTTTIGKKSVVVFKSDSHMSQDGPQLPNIDVWRQIIQEVQPSLVITTGTAGGIGKECEVGDVVVSPIVRFDCTAKFKGKPFAQDHYESSAPKASHFATARTLFKANAAQLPKDNTRPPKIIRVPLSDLTSAVLTTDFFGFDTSDDHYKLQGLGSVSEMGDAVLGLVASDDGREGAALAGDPQRLRPADRCDGTDAQAAGGDGGHHLQGLRSMELGLQRHHLLGLDRGGIATRPVGARGMGHPRYRVALPTSLAPSSTTAERLATDGSYVGVKSRSAPMRAPRSSRWARRSSRSSALHQAAGPVHLRPPSRRRSGHPHCHFLEVQ